MPQIFSGSTTSECGRWGRGGQGGAIGDKIRATVTEQQLIRENNFLKVTCSMWALSKQTFITVFGASMLVDIAKEHVWQAMIKELVNSIHYIVKIWLHFINNLIYLLII